MEFDKSKVYTALNADELKVGSKIIFADDLSSLQSRVIDASSVWIGTLESIWGNKQ